MQQEISNTSSLGHDAIEQGRQRCLALTRRILHRHDTLVKHHFLQSSDTRRIQRSTDDYGTEIGVRLLPRGSQWIALFVPLPASLSY